MVLCVSTDKAPTPGAKTWCSANTNSLLGQSEALATSGARGGGGVTMIDDQRWKTATFVGVSYSKLPGLMFTVYWNTQHRLLLAVTTQENSHLYSVRLLYERVPQFEQKNTHKKQMLAAEPHHRWWCIHLNHVILKHTVTPLNSKTSPLSN